jgi:hypothetical protein
MKGYKIKVMKPYRKLVTNVSRSGYVQRRGSSKPVKFKSRKQALATSKLYNYKEVKKYERI